jgi:monothiol glutaredoxin
MGIRKKIKKALPIFGRKTEASKPQSSYNPNRYPSEEPVFTPAEPKLARGDVAPREYIKQMVSENKIVLFMKGSPQQPLCGFSANASQILGASGKPYAHIDVIADYEVREDIKTFSQWPTLPQIYLNGEFLGGSDILKEMNEDGSLKTQIEEAFAE